MKIKKFKSDANNTVLFLEKIDNEILKKALYFLELEDYKNDKNLIKQKNAKKRTRQVFRFEINGKMYYCKKYVNNNFFKIIQDLFRNQRAVRAFKLSVFLNNHNIQTIKPVLAVNDGKRFFHRASVIITEECKGITIKKVLLNDIKEEDKQKLIEKCVNLYIKLIKMKIYHRDPNFSNLMLSQNELILIDLDDVRKIPFYSFRLLFRNLEKLNRILLLSYTRNKEINFNNQDRENIIKKLISNSYNRINQIKYLEMVNLYTRFKMKKHFKTHESISRYLKGGTIEEIDNYLFRDHISKRNRIIKNIIPNPDKPEPNRINRTLMMSITQFCTNPNINKNSANPYHPRYLFSVLKKFLPQKTINSELRY